MARIRDTLKSIQSVHNKKNRKNLYYEQPDRSIKDHFKFKDFAQSGYDYQDQILAEMIKMHRDGISPEKIFNWVDETAKDYAKTHLKRKFKSIVLKKHYDDVDSSLKEF